MSAVVHHRSLRLMRTPGQGDSAATQQTFTFMNMIKRPKNKARWGSPADLEVVSGDDPDHRPYGIDCHQKFTKNSFFFHLAFTLGSSSGSRSRVANLATLTVRGPFLALSPSTGRQCGAPATGNKKHSDRGARYRPAVVTRFVNFFTNPVRLF